MKNIFKLFLEKLTNDTSYKRVYRYLFEKHVGIILVLLLIAGSNVIVRNTVVPLTVTNDTLQYIETAKHFSGDKTAQVYGHRILKPLAPLFVYYVHTILNIDYLTSLEFISILFYYFLSIIIYFFLFTFLHKRKEAFIGSLLYITSYPMLMYGLDLYTETGAWFFHLLGLYFALIYFKKQKIKFIIYSSTAITLGFLWKEYAALAGIALCALILLAKLPLKTKLAHLSVSATVALPILIWWQIHVYQTYNYSYLDWFIIGQSEPEETSQFSLFYISKSLFALSLLGWLFVFGGMLKLNTFTKKEKIAGAVFTITSLGFFLWGYVSSRLYYVLAPMLTILESRGISWFSKIKTQSILVFLIIISSYTWLIVRNTTSIQLLLKSL